MREPRDAEPLNAMFGGQARRERAAARWLAAMGNEGEAFDRARFERWRAHPANARAFDEAAASWGRDLPIAASRYARERRAGDTAAAPVVWPRRAGLAAIAALVIATVAGVGYRSAELPRPAAPGQARPGAGQVATARGDVRAFRLSDGSVATLDGGSALAVAFVGDVRALALLRGHARFVVAHDVNRPFEVRAGQSLIIAHGTIFDVRLVAQGVRVVLLRGAIDVERLDGAKPTGEVRRLTPGQGLTVPAAGPIGATAPATAADAAPIQPMLSFDRTPIAEAVAAFNRRNAVQILLADGAARGETLSGGFAADDPDGFAQMLAAMFKLALSRSDGELVLAAER